MAEGSMAAAAGAPRVKVKNKSPANVQITAEQLIREAWESQDAPPTRAPLQHFADGEELRDYQRVKRKEFEDKIIRNRSHVPIWLTYAKWEEAQNEFERARSIYERALDYDHRSHVLWLHYAEFEMRAKFVNHARNVWDRAVALLPRVSQLWLRYAYMEEVLGRVDLARLVFRRWVDWHPEPNAYSAFVKFEIRNGAIDNARAVFELFVVAHPATVTYLKYARFEERQGNVRRARDVFERATEELPEPLRFSTLYKAFAAFEERHREIDRARAIYKFAVKHLPEKYADEIGAAYTAFEKQRGGGELLEQVLVEKRRAEYEKVLAAKPEDYDAWFDLAALEESAGNHDRVRAVYERATKMLPENETKRAWQRYIYLWLRYATWEELGAKDMERAANVYRAALAVIPKKHALFSFGKLWLHAAELEVRRRNLKDARKLLGNALGVLPHKHSLYRAYIRMELTLTEVDRARILYRKWTERNPTVSDPYIEFAGMEEALGELERARQIFEIALSMPLMDVPETVWKSYIDFEIRVEERGNAVKLYERMLEGNKGLSVWLSYAKFVEEEGDKARAVYKRAYRCMKERVMDEPKNTVVREDVCLVVEKWTEWERKHGDEESLRAALKLKPSKMSRKRKLDTGEEEEVWEIVFPEEQVRKPITKALAAARKWKARKLAKEAGGAREATST